MPLPPRRLEELPLSYTCSSGPASPCGARTAFESRMHAPVRATDFHKHTATLTVERCVLGVKRAWLSDNMSGPRLQTE